MVFTNSSLVSKVQLRSDHYNERPGKISKITIHHAAGCMDMESLLNYLSTTDREVSANYVLSGGKLGLSVEEKYRPWTSSSPSNDNVAVTIEVANSSIGGDWPISDADLKMLIIWCADVCKRNNIPKLYFDGTENGTLTFHYMFADTGCPGPYIKAKANYICDETNKLLNSSDFETIIKEHGGNLDLTAFDYAESGSLVSVEPDYKDIDCFIITLDRNSGKVDYDKLKEIGVIGAMIEEGGLYDVTHREKEIYVSPKLDSQVREAVKHEITYGLYADVRARTIEEANKELSMLRIYASKYTPPLGIWLTLNLSKSKAVNDKIIARYKEVLENAGFYGKMGFYVTRNQLEKVTWSKWKDSFLLLLIDHVSNISEIEKILTPEFFMLKKK